jgi:hypothetical protein
MREQSFYSSIIIFSLLLSFQCYDALKLGKPMFSSRQVKPKAVDPDFSPAASTEPLNPVKFTSAVPDIFHEYSDPDVELNEIVVKINKSVIGIVKDMLGVIYGDRHYARFAALEVIARVPYFSCKSTLNYV